MLNTKLKHILLCLSSIAFGACSGAGGSSSGSSELSQIQAAFSSATGAVTSIYSGFTAFSSITCASGAPTSSTPGDAAFAGEDAYCALNTNTKSPDTIQGSYFLVSALLCAAEKQISFVYDTAPTTHNGLIIDENDSCFGQGGFDGSGDAATTFQISLQDKAMTVGDYDYFVGIELGPTYTAPNVSFYLKDSSGIVAARIYSAAFDYIFEFVMDSNTGKFYYENKDYGQDRHIRLAATGTFSTTTGSFSSVTDAKYIHSEGEYSAGVSGQSVMMDFDGTSDDYDHYANGTQAAGYSALTGVTHDPAFYQWGSVAIGDHTPDTDAMLDLSNFDMSF